MTEPFRVRMQVRSYEIDSQAHVNQAVYHQYGEHARVELMRDRGIAPDVLRERGLGMVVLESHIRYLRELMVGDEVDVTASLRFGEGKTFHIDHEIRKLDGTVSADIAVRVGLLDLAGRKLVAEPEAVLASVCSPQSTDGSGSHTART